MGEGRESGCRKGGRRARKDDGGRRGENEDSSRALSVRSMARSVRRCEVRSEERLAWAIQLGEWRCEREVEDGRRSCPASKGSPSSPYALDSPSASKSPPLEVKQSRGTSSSATCWVRSRKPLPPPVLESLVGSHFASFDASLLLLLRQATQARARRCPAPRASADDPSLLLHHCCQQQRRAWVP